MRPTVHRSLTFITTFVVGVVLSAVTFYLFSPSGQVRPIDLNDDSRPPAVILVDTTPDSHIRKVDFTNFDYPGLQGMPRHLKVRDGKRPPKRRDWVGRPFDISLSIGDVTYGDVTGDGEEDAIVDLGWETGGTADLSLVYIYTINNAKLRLLWAFETGDRSDGGMKSVYALDGGLVIELFGKDKFIGRDLYAFDGVHLADCCPVLFTRTRYVWKGRGFRRIGSEVLSYNPEQAQ